MLLVLEQLAVQLAVHIHGVLLQHVSLVSIHQECLVAEASTVDVAVALALGVASAVEAGHCCQLPFLAIRNRSVDASSVS